MYVRAKASDGKKLGNPCALKFVFTELHKVEVYTQTRILRNLLEVNYQYI